MSEAELLVSGATGRTGGAAIDELLKMEKRVRAYVRADDGASGRPAQARCRHCHRRFHQRRRYPRSRGRHQVGLFPSSHHARHHQRCRLFRSGRERSGCNGDRQHVADFRPARVGQPRCAKPLDFRAGLRLVRSGNDALASDLLCRLARLSAFRSGDLGQEENRVSLRKRTACPNQHRRPGTSHRPYPGQSERPRGQNLLTTWPRSR